MNLKQKKYDLMNTRKGLLDEAKVILMKDGQTEDYTAKMADVEKLNGQITSLNLKLSALSKKRTRLYEDFAEGVLDEEEYSFAKKSYDEQYADLSRRLDEAVQRRSKFSEAMSVDNKWITLMKSVSTATRLTQDLVDESIELVKVHENGAIELIMKYGDLYALTLQSIKEVQEAM